MSQLPRRIETPTKGKKADTFIPGVTDQYISVDLSEHILHRPDSYVGSTRPTLSTQWIADWNVLTPPEEKKFVRKEIMLTEAFYKIFDEILVNAADNRVKDPSMDHIRVSVNTQDGSISVWNNGAGIPIQIQPGESIYIPEFIFGTLLSSSNFQDEGERLAGGRNGYGAKVTNIFSRRFQVRTANSRAHTGHPLPKRIYTQVWENNMKVVHPPVIEDYVGPAQDYTEVTFWPDYDRLGMPQGITPDLVALIRRRTLDMAGILNLPTSKDQGKRMKKFSVEMSVLLPDGRVDSEHVSFNSFPEYVQLYMGEDKIVLSYEIPRWSVVITASDTPTFDQMSFVNGIATISGGTHVDMVTDQVTQSIFEKLNRKKNNLIQRNRIKQQLWIFVACYINRPSFNSQTKEKLITPKSDFGSQLDLPDAFLKKVRDHEEIMMKIETLEKVEEARALRATESKLSRRVRVEKLEDAGYAGVKNAPEQPTLFIVEGDSAATLPMAGRNSMPRGTDLIGVYPIRGKILNLRDATLKQATENTFIMNMAIIMGWNAETIKNRSLWRYGRIAIMTDEDDDGAHIAGLIINFLDARWGITLTLPDFLFRMKTPIVRFIHGEGKNSKRFYAYSKEEADMFAEKNPTWRAVFLKGLGTSDVKDAVYYFSNLDKHLVRFHPATPGERDLIDQMFNKKRADERKAFLSDNAMIWKRIIGEEEKTFELEMTLTRFFNTDMKEFGHRANERSISSLCDGLRPTQRKILFTNFKGGADKSVKIESYAGKVIAEMHYHHGASSLIDTITRMSQTFVGKNIPYFNAESMVGTRRQNGGDAAQSRYVYVTANKLIRYVFPEIDDMLLARVKAEGVEIEPLYFVGVIPWLLVNGTGEGGMGWGYRGEIPPFNPHDLITKIRQRFARQPEIKLLPWWRGFKGRVSQVSETSWRTYGVAKIEKNVLHISEIPIGISIEEMEEFLKDLEARDEGNIAQVLNTLSNEDFSQFTIRAVLKKGFTSDIADVIKKKLTSTVSATLNFYDGEVKIRSFSTVEEVFDAWYDVREQMYRYRKQELEKKWVPEIALLENRVRFIQLYVTGELILFNRPEEEIKADMTRFGLQEHDKLLEMSIRSLTRDRIQELQKTIERRKKELDHLKNAPVEVLWEEDLAVFEKQYNAWLSKFG